MKCPRCSVGTAWVIDSREKDGSVRRRRRCKECGYRFTTAEVGVEDLKRIAVMAARIISDVKKM